MSLRSNYHEFFLPNGLKVCLFEIPSVMSVYAEITIRVGAIDEKENERGISHFLEHSAFHGTEKHPSHKDIAEYTESHGIWHIAGTGGSSTHYQVKFPDNEKENGIDFLHELVFKPLYKPEDIEREKQVILSEYGMFWNNPDRKFGQMSLEKRFQGKPHIYARRPMGVPDSFMNMKPEQLMKWKNKYYCAKNMLLTLAGNISLKEAKQLTRKYFAKEVPGEFNEQPFCSKKDYSNYSLYVQPENRDQIGFELNFPLYGTGDKKREERITTYCFLRSLGGCTSSRLFQRIRNKERLVYSIRLSQTMYKHLGLVSIYGSATKNNILNVMRAIREEVDLASTKGITEDELKLSKNAQKASIRMGFESPETVAGGIIRQIFDTDQQYWFPEDEEKFLKTLKLKDVNNSIKGIFDYEKININLIGELNDKEIKDIEKVFEK